MDTHVIYCRDHLKQFQKPPDGCGLDRGQMYYFRVRAMQSGGLSPWSDIAQKRAS